MSLTKTAERMKASLARMQANIDNSLKQLDTIKMGIRVDQRKLDELTARTDRLITNIKARDPHFFDRASAR